MEVLEENQELGKEYDELKKRFVSIESKLYIATKTLEQHWESFVHNSESQHAVICLLKKKLEIEKNKNKRMKKKR
jgi:hypothetical protein